MARSFVYKRPLDAKILPSSENSNHEFQFNTLLEIKREVENDQLDVETGLSPGTTVTNSGSLYDDHNSELHSSNTSNQFDECNDAPHPKLVIKFRDLWRRSEHNIDLPKKIRKNEGEELENEIVAMRKLRANKSRRSEFSVSSEDRVTRSSLLKPRVSDCNQDTKGTSNCSQEEIVSNEEEKQDVWNFGRITRLKKNLNRCESCGMCFRSDKQLQAHKRYYTANGQFHCDVCDIRFSRSFQLSRHLKVAHSTPSNENNYKFKCHLCIDRFEKKASLIAHVTHLHNKHVVANKKSINCNKELPSFPNSSAIRQKKKASKRKSERVQKHVVPINSNYRETILNADSGMTKDLNELVGNCYNKDEHLIHQNSRAQQDYECPGNQLTDDNLHFDNKKTNASSTQHLANINYSEHIERVILENSDEKVVTTQQRIQSSINDSSKNSIKPGHGPERIAELTFSSRQQLSKKTRSAPRLQEHDEERNQMQRRNQTGQGIAPGYVQSQLGGNLVDHLGNTVGNWCVPELFHQPNKCDYVSDCSSASITVDPINRSSEMEMVNMLRCTRSTTLKTTILNCPIRNTMNTATYSNQKLTQNEDLSIQEKNMYAMEDKYMTSKVHPHLDGVSQILQLRPQHKQLDRQVGSVLSHQVSEDFEAAEKNVNTDDAAVECNNFGINLIQVDDFGETCKSTFVNCGGGEASDGSCESISLKMTASSSNVSLADSLSLKSHNATVLTSYNIPNNQKIKDVRVLLVKLENMLDVSSKNVPPKLSPLENCSLVKTETPYCNPCEKQFVSKLGLWQHSRRKYNNGEDKPNEDLGSIIRKKRVVTNHFPKALLYKNRVRKHRNSEQRLSRVSGKHCYFCDQVFQNNISAADHYLSMHTVVGVFQCCLCSSNFKNLRKLRFHLFRHYNGLATRKWNKFCIVCKKELHIPSLNQRCPECNQDSTTKQCNSRRETFVNAQDLTEHQLAHIQASDKVYALENRSVSLLETSPVLMSKEKSEINTPVVDHESAKNHKKVVSSKTCEEISTNFKCLACNSVFSERIRLKYHLLRTHGIVKYCKCERCQNVVKLQRLSRLISRGCKNEPRKCLERKDNLEKFSVGKKKNVKSKDIDTHDKLCKKKSHARRRLKCLQTNSKNQHFIRQHHIRGNMKTCYNHKCDVCGLNCCCRRSLKIHKTRYLTNGNNVCNICGLTFAWKHVLVVHMKTAHNPKILFYGRVRCEICNQGFYNKKFLRIHLAHFHNIKYYQCRICRIRFDTCRSLNNHRRYYSKNLSSLCGICGQSFKCKYMLEYHKAQVHNREKLRAYKYFCDMCNCAFLDELLLQAHIGHFHNIQDRDAEKNAITKNVSKETEQLFKNIELPVKTENVCNNSNITTNNSTVREHVNKIHRAQRTTADVVDKTIRTHNSSEYKCGICKLSFNDAYAILNHEWEFSNDGTYACHVCNRKFTTDSLLKNHKIKHYQRNVIRKYECYVCKEDFSRIDHLKMHGLHLHGPEFVWEKGSETPAIHNQNVLKSRTNRDCDGISNKSSIDNAYDTIGLMASNEVTESGKILLFQKIANNRSSMELLRRHSNEDAHCCNFCKTNFSSASLLDEHIKKHAYRAYYTNSSRYLCLICKHKFRTNDILRAHVIYCHTSDQNESNLSESGQSKDSVSNKLIELQTHSNDRQTAVNKAGNVADNLPSEHAIQNHLFSSEKCDSIQLLNSTPASKQRLLFNSASDVGIFQSDHSYRTSMPREVEYKIENDFECNELGGGDDRNCSELELAEPGYSEITLHIDSDSIPEEAKLFTIRVEDVMGLKKHTCIMCIVTFKSVAQFTEHFASVHVKNGAYVCTFCGEKFPVMSELKYHIFRHEEEPKIYVCCDKEFRLIADFVHHQLSHDGQIEEKQNKPNTRLSLVEAGPLKQFDDESNVNEPVKLSYKCEICDKVFVDFKTMLKHWDSCIDTNGLQCDMCRATFKSLNSFRLHKMIYHEKKKNFNTIQNRRSFRANSDQIIQTSMPNSIVGNKLGSKTTIDNSVNVNATKKTERAVASSDKFSKQNELLKFGKITIKPFARILKNSKNNNERCVIEHQENDANDASKSRPELKSNQGTQSSKQRGIPRMAQKKISNENVRKKLCLQLNGNTSTPLSIAPRSIKSITQVGQPDDQVSNNISSNTNQNRLLYHLPVQDSNNISKQRFAPNDFSLRLQQSEYKERRLAASQPDFSGSANNLSSIQPTTLSSIKIGNTKVGSSESGQKSRLNDCEDKRQLNLLPASLNTVDSSAYYLCIQPVADSSDNTNNVTLVPSDSSPKLQLNDGTGKILPNFVPVSLNPGVSSTYFLCVKPSSDSSSKCSTQTVPLNVSKLKSDLNNRAAKKLPMLVQKSSNVVLTPIHASDVQRIASNSNSKNKQSIVLNDSTLRSNYSKDTTVPISPAIAGTSTGGNLPTSHKNATKDRNISIKKSASNKKFILRKQVVRCSYCNLLFTEKAKLIKHMGSHKTDNQCPACGLTFSNERALQQHLPEHKSSTCTKCNMIFFFSDSIALLTGRQKYCSVCNTLLPLPVRQLNRSENNSARHIMKCGICMDTFGTFSEMSVHFKKVHSSFICGICESRFSTQTSLQNHIRIHGSDTFETFQCTTCKKYFIDKSDLAEHVLSHQIAHGILKSV